jgi:hypothetical protein
MLVSPEGGVEAQCVEAASCSWGSEQATQAVPDFVSSRRCDMTHNQTQQFGCLYSLNIIIMTEPVMLYKFQLWNYKGPGLPMASLYIHYVQCEYQ